MPYQTQDDPQRPPPAPPGPNNGIGYWLGGGARGYGGRPGTPWGYGAPQAPAAGQSNLENEMRSRASDIARQEQQRYESGLGVARDAYARSERSLSQLIDPDLLFSRASDAIGARGVDSMNRMRQSMGARGINPNSGAANGMLSRLAFEQNNAITGATRDVAIENQRQRQVNAAQSFQNAMNLSAYINSPVSGIEYENAQNLFEGQIAREGIASQRDSNHEAAQTGLLGSIIGAVGGVLGGLI